MGPNLFRGSRKDSRVAVVNANRKRFRDAKPRVLTLRGRMAGLPDALPLAEDLEVL